MLMMDLSMGMSCDYKEVIEFGLIFVRIGIVFFKQERNMFLKDRFDKFIDYFIEDGEDVGIVYQFKVEELIVILVFFV